MTHHKYLEGRLDIASEVKEVLSTFLMLNVSLLNDNANLVEDFKLSSVDHVEIIMNLEEEFEIELTPRDHEAIITIGDAIRIVGEKIVWPPAPMKL